MDLNTYDIVDMFSNQNIPITSNDWEVSMNQIYHDVAVQFYKQNHDVLNKYRISFVDSEYTTIQQMIEIFNHHVLAYPLEIPGIDANGEMYKQYTIKAIYDNNRTLYNDIVNKLAESQDLIQQLIDNIIINQWLLDTDKNILKILFYQQGQQDIYLKLYSHPKHKNNIEKLFKSQIHQNKKIIKQNSNDLFKDLGIELRYDTNNFEKIKQNFNYIYYSESAIDALIKSSHIENYILQIICEDIDTYKDKFRDNYNTNIRSSPISSEIVIFPYNRVENIFVHYFDDIYINTINIKNYLYNTLHNMISEIDDFQYLKTKIHSNLYKLVCVDSIDKQTIYMYIDQFTYNRQATINLLTSVTTDEQVFNKYSDYSDQQLVKLVGYDSVQQWLEQWYYDQFNRRQFYMQHKDDLNQSIYRLIRIK